MHKFKTLGGSLPVSAVIGTTYVFPGINLHLPHNSSSSKQRPVLSWRDFRRLQKASSLGSLGASIWKQLPDHKRMLGLRTPNLYNCLLITAILWCCPIPFHRFQKSLHIEQQWSLLLSTNRIQIDIRLYDNSKN